MSYEPADLVPLLPVIVPAALITYALIVTFGGTWLRRKRLRDEARRRATDSRPPWDRWLDEINRRVGTEKKPGAIEKWRE
ncbi:hypothetical protein [Sphingomonas vulcanisoli]|uniref:hypothetical protein n=1 Tax=Sphingomonas vulcanisoli TaxID=1658060 RepID=UPI00141FFD54|nr:hypothetical protein [Sphingomonas vulcanisoli]